MTEMLGLALGGAEVRIPGSPIRRDLLLRLNNIPACVTIYNVYTTVETELVIFKTCIARHGTEDEEDASDEVRHQHVHPLRARYLSCGRVK